MSLQLVCPNEPSALPQLSNAATPITHDLVIKSNANTASNAVLKSQSRQDVEMAAIKSDTDQNRQDNTHAKDSVPNDENAPIKKKTCVKCKQEKTTLEFHKYSRSSDGLHSYCKDCNRAQALAHIKAEKARKALARAARKIATSKP